MSSCEEFEIENGILKAYKGTANEVTVPEGVTEIGDDAFKGMAHLLKVKLPESVRKIGDRAFKGCRQLNEVNFPCGLTEIGEYAFHRCHCMEEMIFPDSVKSVGSYAFLYCDGVRKVVMEGPVSIKRAVFSHNLSLRELYINENVDFSNFSDEVFEGCVNLSKISLSGKEYEIANLIDAMNSHSDYPEVIRAIAKSVYHSLQIEEGVLVSFNVNLKKVSLPEGITAIGKSCFFDKKGIISIEFPESLREIRANAFLNCISLEEVFIKRGNLITDDKAFRGCCNLKKVHVGEEEYSLEEEPSNELASRIRDQVLGDFYISGKILVRYLGDEEQVRIPKEVEVIGERCFFGNERLKAVTCPGNLREIREQAFEGCLTLQNVVLPASFKRIEREAFAECKKLLKINIPEGIEFIGEYAFRRCFVLPAFDPWPVNAEIHPYAFYRAGNFAEIEAGLKEKSRLFFEEGTAIESGAGFIAPYSSANKEGIKTLDLSGVKRIGKYAYAGCPDLEEIVIDSPDCIIESKAFSNCPKLKKVSLHVKEMGTGIFAYCRNLEEVHLSGIESLPAESFAGCFKLSTFEAKELSGMEARCFDECVNLQSFDFTGIKYIGDRAFERCDSLKKVSLDDTVCGYHAFADLSSLETVEITSKTVLKSCVFIGSTQINTIVYDGVRYEFDKFSDGLNHAGNIYPEAVKELISSIYSCYDIRDGKRLLGYSQDAVRVTIPNDIEEIGADVFRDHIRLKEISVPESVNVFGSHAFSQTAWLDDKRAESEMVIVNGILIDGAGCKGKVTIPASVKKIAGWCFAGNVDITHLVLPYEKLAIEALSFRNCINLKKITDHTGKEYVLENVADLSGTGFPELVKRIFSECINCFKLDDDHNLIESTGNIINLVFPQGIKSVGDDVYKDCHLLESIVLADDTEVIGKSAFENSKWLKTVKGASAVKSIGALAFSGCQSLESIDLSDAVEEIGSRCFEHCSNLKEIKISEGLERIPERAFFRCKSLKKITVPASVKVIEAESFAFCDGLEEVYVSDKTQVADNAFAWCDNISIIRYTGDKAGGRT
ncbi:MAG: leucine-rich repeat protein [Lachnospiraceae bacterium]|nr:leucine-rich repeat protein [Lachnospiraceae bacterium]